MQMVDIHMEVASMGMNVVTQGEHIAEAERCEGEPKRGYSQTRGKPREVSITEAKGEHDEIYIQNKRLMTLTAQSSTDRNELEKRTPLFKKIPNSYFQGHS